MQGLVAAYISLATFVEDEQIVEIIEKPERSARVYRKVMKNMDAYEQEIRGFLRKLCEPDLSAKED